MGRHPSRSERGAQGIQGLRHPMHADGIPHPNTRRGSAARLHET